MLLRFPKKASIWCNPFKLGKNCTSREDSLRLFKEHITSLIEGDPETYNLEELRGKNLGCWCHPDSCHGDVLLKLLETKAKSLNHHKSDLDKFEYDENCEYCIKALSNLFL